MSKTSDKADDIRDALLDNLLTAVKDGVRVATKDGEVVTVDAPPAVLAVAFNIVKQFAKPDSDEANAAKAENVSRFLSRYEQPKGAPRAN